MSKPKRIVVIQFKPDHTVGRPDERRAQGPPQVPWDQWQPLAARIGNALAQSGIDSQDDGQVGGGRSEFFYYVHDVDEAVATIMRMLVDAGYIRWAKIAYFDEDRQEWRVIHPEEETDFSLFAGSPDG